MTELALSGTAPLWITPDEAAHAAAIDRLVDDAFAERRAHFLAAVADRPADVVAKAIRDLCAKGLGCWTEPRAADSRRRPATHQHEVTLWQVSGFGLTPEECARSWCRAARNLAGQEDAE
jgi:hypothetical protein